LGLHEGTFAIPDFADKNIISVILLGLMHNQMKPL
jgi:hypothetical protein